MTNLRVMTWNVLYKENADKILQFIEQIKPDILCCQEITKNSYINPNRDVPSEASKIIGGEYRYLSILPTLEDKPGDMGNAIISGYPIKGHRQILVQNGGSDISYSAQNRGYIEVKIEVDGKILTVGTTHLSYVDGFIETEARSKEADKLLNFIEGNNEKYMILGDFNSSPDSSTIKKLEKKLKNTGPDQKELTFTTKPFKHGDFEVNGLEWRLDYIFVTPDIKVLSCEILITDTSDHLPILAEIEI